ncbi:hypothetical protein LXL04_027592 [Taraxacum kok-saghyz]
MGNTKEVAAPVEEIDGKTYVIEQRQVEVAQVDWCSGGGGAGFCSKAEMEHKSKGSEEESLGYRILMIKAHLILCQPGLIFTSLTDFWSVWTDFYSIWSDFGSEPNPNPTRSTTQRRFPAKKSGDLRRVLAPASSSHGTLLRRTPYSPAYSDANPSAPTSSATISVTSYHLRRTFVAIFFLLRRPLSRSSFSRRKPFCSDVLYRDLVSPNAKLLCPDIRLLSMAENNKIEEAYVLEIASMLGRNQWVHIEKTWMSPLWYLWTPWKDLQKSRTSRGRRSRRVCVGIGRRRRCASQQGRVGGGSWSKDASELVGGRRISWPEIASEEQKTVGIEFQKKGASPILPFTITEFTPKFHPTKNQRKNVVHQFSRRIAHVFKPPIISDFPSTPNESITHRVEDLLFLGTIPP